MQSLHCPAAHSLSKSSPTSKTSRVHLRVYTYQSESLDQQVAYSAASEALNAIFEAASIVQLPQPTKYQGQLGQLFSGLLKLSNVFNLARGKLASWLKYRQQDAYVTVRGPAVIEGEGGEIPDSGDSGELSAPPNQSTELETNTVAASFTVFGNLPTEVRFKIWKYALPSHKSFVLRVHVFRSVNKRDNTYKVKFLIDNLIERLSLDERSTQGLGLSRACRESRKMYNEEFPYFLPMLGVKQKGPLELPTRGVRLKSIGCLRFNKDTIICMQNMQELRFTADKPMAEPLDKFWFDIKHLAYQVNLTIAEPPPAQLAPAPAPAPAPALDTETSVPTYWFADQISRFPNLETITTVVDLNQVFYREFPQTYIDQVLGFIMNDASTGVKLRKAENPEYKVPTLFFQSWKDGVPFDRRKYVGKANIGDGE